MRISLSKGIMLVLLAVCCSTSTAAGLDNPGFETGDLTGLGLSGLGGYSHTKV